MADLCILTPEPGFHERWKPDGDALAALFGDRLAFRPWTEAGDLSGFALVMPLIAWGYHLDCARWYRLLDGWEADGIAFANTIPVLRWNTDKDYLIDLAAAGVPVVPTREVHDLSGDDLVEARSAFGCDNLVIKPAISAGANRTYRLKPGDQVPFDVLGREMLIQPEMASIAEEGEYSLFIFAGELAHAIIKRPAEGDFRVQTQFGGQEQTITPPDDAIDCAATAIAACPETPLYARVDMARDGAGQFRLMELELIEPSLFLPFDPEGGGAFRSAVERLLDSQSK